MNDNTPKGSSELQESKDDSKDPKKTKKRPVRPQQGQTFSGRGVEKRG